MNNKQAFHAINVFIEPWFREEIIENVLEDFSKYTEESRKELAETLKNDVKVSGFRKTLTAPKRLLIREAAKVFESNPFFVAVVLNCWMQLYSQNDKTFVSSLKELGFEVPAEMLSYADPINAFDQGWPEGLDYAKLIETVRKTDDKLEMSDDQIVFYSILRTGCLPSEKEAEND